MSDTVSRSRSESQTRRLRVSVDALSESEGERPLGASLGADQMAAQIDAHAQRHGAAAGSGSPGSAAVASSSSSSSAAAAAADAGPAGGSFQRRSAGGGELLPLTSGAGGELRLDLGSRMQQAERDLANQDDGWEFAGWGNSSSVSFFDSTQTSSRVVGASAGAGASVNNGGGGGSDSDDSSDAARGPTEGDALLGSTVRDADPSELDPTKRAPAPAHKLNQFYATSIAGNDISSSCFYMVGIAAFVAGRFAPVSVAMVIIVLYFFRNIYGEVCTALPLNGGTYNALLNTTTKQVAAVAAGLTLLSYLATAVVSATSAVSYLETQIQLKDAEAEQLFLVWCSVGVLGLFAILNFIGLGESAIVALIIFIGHLTTLLVLVGVMVVQLFMYPNWAVPDKAGSCGDHNCHDLYNSKNMSIFGTLAYNWSEHAKAPDGTVGVAAQIFFGFSSALIGVSGFESSANYIEEQAQGVFVKTLRNMWYIVAFFNPIFSLLAIMTLNLEDVANKTVQNAILAKMVQKNYPWMATWITVDAFIVLSGAVLTSYVGVNGLVRRMSLDKCLPQFLLWENPLRHTPHFIIFGFFFLTASLCVLTNAQVDVLAGVYCIAFLAVMALFAVSDMLLKYKRKLASEVTSSWLGVFLALAAVLAGAFGNIVHNLEYLEYFSFYFIGAMAAIFVMFTRVSMLKIAFFALSKSLPADSKANKWIQRQVRTIRHQPVIFFTRTGQLATLNKAALYVRENEETDWLRIVHVYSEHDKEFADRLEANVAILDQLYPKMRVDLVMVHGVFNPDTIHWLSVQLNVPANYMFITAPSVGTFPHNLGDLGGVRVVTH